MKKVSYINLLIEKEVKSLFFEAFRGFNLSKFQKIQDPIKRYEYANSHLPKLGQGSSRVVFGLGAGKVLKIVGNYSRYEEHKIIYDVYKNMFDMFGKEKFTEKIENHLKNGLK